MPDWKALVRECVRSLGLTHELEEEVVAELADHLQDRYEEGRAQGLCQSEAMDRSLEQAADWRRLVQQTQRVQRKEEIMKYRSKGLWLPGLISMALSAGWMFFLQQILAPGQGPWKHAGLPLALYLVWLATLPLFGAISACLSKRQGGEQLSRIAASLFLPLVMFGFWIAVTIYLAMRADGRPMQWANICLTALNWVVLPGLSLLLGALPFLGIRRSIAGKEIMNHRTKALWLPGLISLAAAMIVFTISTRVGLQPRFLAHGLTNAVVYLGWLLPLPFCGAIGAYLSRRAGGQRLARLAAGVFPAIAMACLVGFLILICQIVLAKPQGSNFGRGLFFGLVLPVVALWLGTIPFLITSRSGSMRSVSS
jgi:hypothetical protein